MRLWSIHPKYLDSKGLVALWREALLAKKVLEGGTKGYTKHPQLERFRSHKNPAAAINAYLQGVYNEACVRGHCFDKRKIGRAKTRVKIPVPSGQAKFEFRHLKKKLKKRSKKKLLELSPVKKIELHPVFKSVPGKTAPWERTN
ncbi:MAG: hypothetical protein JW772_01090 [Candidatus Diapherotrites archaeon]|nr:hypothetical protein [Candidatus Diapherotrites archaeon]